MDSVHHRWHTLLSLPIKRIPHLYRTRIKISCFVQSVDLVAHVSGARVSSSLRWCEPEYGQVHSDDTHHTVLQGPHTLQTFSDHPSLLEIIPDNIIVITLHYKAKHRKNTFRRLHSFVTQKPISVYIREKKKSTRKRNTIQGRKKQLFFYT